MERRVNQMLAVVAATALITLGWLVAPTALASILDTINDALVKESLLSLPELVCEHDALRAAVAAGSQDGDGHAALAARAERWAKETLASARERGAAGGLLPTALAS